MVGFPRPTQFNGQKADKFSIEGEEFMDLFDRGECGAAEKRQRPATPAPSTVGVWDSRRSTQLNASDCPRSSKHRVSLNQQLCIKRVYFGLLLRRFVSVSRTNETKGIPI